MEVRIKTVIETQKRGELGVWEVSKMVGFIHSDPDEYGNEDIGFHVPECNIGFQVPRYAIEEFLRKTKEII